MTARVKETASRVGIDIGSSSIKILQVSGPVDTPELLGIGVRNIVKPQATEIADSLKALAEEANITTSDARISISGPSVIVRFISLPKMDENALKSAIKYEAEKFIPYNISECVVDFQTLKKDEKENKLSILLVAAKKEYVSERIKLAEKAGFAVSVVDIDSFAVANAFVANHKSIEDKSYAVLNIGAARTNLNILKGSMIQFVRDIAMGGDDFTAAISKKLNIDRQAAEAMKLAPPKNKEADISECVKGVFNDLLDEAKLSFGYYENQAGKSIDEIYVSGGGVNIAELEQMFEEVLGSKPILWDPFGFINIKSAEALKPGCIDGVKRSFAVACGLVSR